MFLTFPLSALLHRLRSLPHHCCRESGKPQSLLRADGCCLALWPSTTLSQNDSEKDREVDDLFCFTSQVLLLEDEWWCLMNRFHPTLGETREPTTISENKKRTFKTQLAGSMRGFLDPCRRWNSKTFWRRPGTENIQLDAGSSNPRRKSSRFPGRIRRVSTTNTFSRLTSEIYWRIQGQSYDSRCNAGKPHRWLLEHRWIKRFVWFFRAHTIHFTKRKTSRRIHVVQGDIHETANNLKTWSLWLEILKSMSRNSKIERKAKFGRRKAEPRKCKKAERNSLHWSWGYGIQRDHQECRAEVGSPSRSC